MKKLCGQKCISLLFLLLITFFMTSCSDASPTKSNPTQSDSSSSDETVELSKQSSEETSEMLINKTKNSTIAIGRNFSVVVSEDGKLWLWGELLNGSHLLPRGQQPDGNRKLRQIPNFDNCSSVFAVDDSIFVIKQDGTVWAFGDNTGGLLGLGMPFSHEEPVMLESLSTEKIIKICANRTWFAALTDDGDVWTWEKPYTFGMAPNSFNPDIYPRLLDDTFSDVADIICEDSAFFALKNDGTVWFWGELPYEVETNRNEIVNFSFYPVQINGLSNIVQIKNNRKSLFALKDDGNVWILGYAYKRVNDNQYFSSKVDSYYGRWAPNPFSETTPFALRMQELSNIRNLETNIGDYYREIFPGNSTFFALDKQDRVFGMGDNALGLLGTGRLVQEWIAKMADIPGVEKLFPHDGATFAVTKDGSLWATGNPAEALKEELDATFYKIDGLNNITDIKTGINSVLALGSDGTIWTWGSQCVNQNGDIVEELSPIEIKGVNGMQSEQKSKRTVSEKRIEDTTIDTENDIISTNTSEEYGTTMSNMVNSGMLVQKDDWLYYSDWLSLKKMKTDGSDVQEILATFDNTSPQGLNIVGDWIYFYEAYNPKPDSIKKMKTDGTELQSIPNAEITFNYALNNRVLVMGDYIYYEDGTYTGGRPDDSTNNIVKIGTDGNNKVIIVSGRCRLIGVVDDCVYYTEGHDRMCNLYKVKPDGSNRTLIAENLNIKSERSVISDDTIFCCNNNDMIHRVSLEGEDLGEINHRTKNFTFIAAYEGSVYFSTINPNQQPALYKINLNNGESGYIFETDYGDDESSFSYINLSDSYAYYLLSYGGSGSREFLELD